MLVFSRYLALTFALCLAIGEAIINSLRDHWQYAPMWIIDYIIVAYLLAGFWATRRGKNPAILMSAFALSAGVMYMALFIAFDPDLPAEVRANTTMLGLLGLVFAVSVVGLVTSMVAWWKARRFE